MNLRTDGHPLALTWDEQIRRVLFLRLRAIGDTVLFTSCLEVLKHWRPELEIDVVMEPLGAPVLYGNPHMSHLYVIPRCGFSLPRYLQRAAVIAALRDRQYDLAIDLRGWRSSMAVLRRCGARQTAMFEESEFSHSATLRIPDAREIWGKSCVHDLERQLAALKWLGVPVGEIPWPRVRIDPRADEATARQLQELEVGERFAVLHVGASHPRKRWAPARFGQVADALWERYRLPSVIIALPSERNIARAVAEAARSNPLVCTGFSLPETIALIGRATVLLGNDSGLAHISGAVGTPTAVIFGPSNLHIWGLWTATPHRIIGRLIPREERCARCGKNDCRTALRCIDRVSVTQVTEALDGLLAEIGVA